MFREFALGLAAVLPGQCAVCRAWPAQPVCEACVARFAQPRPRCRRCALPVAPGIAECGRCLAAPPPLDGCHAAVAYEYPWSALIGRYKFGGQAGWAHSFALLMRSAPWVEPALEEADVVLPLPLSRERLAERGFNQALLLARALAPRKADPTLLLRVRNTPAQTELDRAGRLANVAGAFAAEPLRAQRLKGKRVVLVDDVMTSGASLYAAAQALRQAGAAGITALVLAIGAMFHIVLVQPEIPPNTGNVIRLAANTGCTLDLIEPLGFSMDDKHMRRAGLDYHEYAQVRRHESWDAFLAAMQPDPARLFALTTRGSRPVHDVGFQPGDWFVFGSETSGLAPALRETFPPAQRLRLPMREGQRSLNLSNAVAVTVFEAWRQNGFGEAPAT